MEDVKVYSPEVVPENPFPGGVEPIVSSPTLPSGTFEPKSAKAVAFPLKKIAVELLSTSLNTRSRKVLGEFELQQSGGFKVGNFAEGVSGDLRITPNGITARDIAGLTTFSIDGTTGNATFAGEVRSGTVVTGDVAVTGSFQLTDTAGNVRVFIGDDGT